MTVYCEIHLAQRAILKEFISNIPILKLIYCEIEHEPFGNPTASAHGIFLMFRLYFTVYPSSCHNTVKYLHWVATHCLIDWCTSKYIGWPVATPDNQKYGWMYGLMVGWRNDYGYGYVSILQLILLLLNHPTIPLHQRLHWQVLQLLQHMLLQQQIQCYVNENVCIVTRVGIYCQI